MVIPCFADVPQKRELDAIRRPGGGKSISEIGGDEAIQNARLMIFLWFNRSVRADYVLDETDLGKKRAILVPVKITDVQIPAGFGQIQTADLSSWNDDSGAAQLRHFVDHLSDDGGNSTPPRAAVRPAAAVMLVVSIIGLGVAFWKQPLTYMVS